MEKEHSILVAVAVAALAAAAVICYKRRNGESPEAGDKETQPSTEDNKGDKTKGEKGKGEA